MANIDGTHSHASIQAAPQPQERTLKSLSNARRVALVVVLTLGSIAFHEFGHFIVYRLGGYPVRITLQSVRPIGDVGSPLGTLALAAGPAFSLVAAGVCLFVARRRRSFFWVTAGFINAATLRLFPLTMDIIRAIKNAKPFSDEGNIALAITTNPLNRVLVLTVIFSAFLSLALVLARLYNFERYRAAKVVGIYVLSLGVAIGVAITDEVLKR